MCSYCEHRKNITKDNFQKSYLQKGLFGYSLIIEFGYINRDYVINCGMINYCPMCGKKLRGKLNIDKKEL